VLRVAAVIALLAFLAVAAVVSDRPEPPADFTYTSGNEATAVDPQKLSWIPDMRVARLLFEGLVRLDVFSWGYDPIPGVAERWHVSPDGLHYSFYLRPDARWSDGAPVTAHDFVYAWRRALLPDTASDYTGQFFLVRGGEEFFHWRAHALEQFSAQDGTRQDARNLWRDTLQQFDRTVGVRAEGDLMFHVELAEPVPYFLDLCALPVFYPVPQHVVERFQTLDDTGAVRIDPAWTKPPRIVGNGPFVMTRWRFKRGMYLEANPEYWNNDALAIRSISIPSIADPNGQVLAFETGAIDWSSDVYVPYRGDMLAQKWEFYDEHRELVSRLRAEGWDQFEIDRRLPDDPRKNIHAIPTFGTYWYNFNCLERLPNGRDNPLADPRVRRALAMAIDKRELVEEIMRLGNPVARTIVPPGAIAGYESPSGLECVSDAVDEAGRESILERARGLLAEAGWPDPSRMPAIEILFNKDSGHDLIAQAVAKHWRQSLGVAVTLSQKELKVYREDMKNADYMVTRAGWYGDYGDPTTFLDVNRTGDGNNDRKYSNPVYDNLLAQARNERDREKRMALLSEAERIIMEEDLPMVPLFHYVTLYTFDADEISGLNPHPRTEQDLFYIDVLGDGQGADVARTMPRR